MATTVQRSRLRTGSPRSVRAENVPALCPPMAMIPGWQAPFAHEADVAAPAEGAATLAIEDWDVFDGRFATGPT